jgi:hypothetical protein
MTRTTIAVAAGLAFAATLPAISAYAAARDRVFVASYGSDSNPCTFGSPCKTFQQAVNVVAVGGEVTAIDSAGFGPVAITQSVTITSPNGVEAGIVAPSFGTAITINATSAATITLRGLTLEGGGVNDFGIKLTSTGGGALNVINTVMKDFAFDGILVVPSSGMYTLMVTDVVASDSDSYGIEIAPTGAAGVAGLIKRATFSGDSSGGTSVDGSSTTGNVDVTIADSSALGNIAGDDGFRAISATGAANTTMFLDNVTANNFNVGIHANNKAIVRMTRSAITKNTTGVTDSGIVSPGAVYTFGDNDIAGNQVPVSGALTPVSPM